MRQFLESDPRRAARHVREAERHVSRQKAVVARFEGFGDKDQAQLARERLAKMEKELEVAKEAERRQPAKPAKWRTGHNTPKGEPSGA